jgi:hypothetical protein
MKRVPPRCSPSSALDRAMQNPRGRVISPPPSARRRRCQPWCGVCPRGGPVRALRGHGAKKNPPGNQRLPEESWLPGPILSPARLPVPPLSPGRQIQRLRCTISGPAGDGASNCAQTPTTVLALGACLASSLPGRRPTHRRAHYRIGGRWPQCGADPGQGPTAGRHGPAPGLSTAASRSRGGHAPAHLRPSTGGGLVPPRSSISTPASLEGAPGRPTCRFSARTGSADPGSRALAAAAHVA